MQVQQMVATEATVTRIVNVKAGDIFKRLHKPSYGEPSLVFGYVTDVLNDGENAVIVVVEFMPGAWGSSTEPTVRSFSNDTDVAIFPATEDEWRTGLNEAIEKQRRTVETAERDAASKRAVLDALSVAMEGGVRVPEVVTIRPDALEA
jgi:ATP:corrinoid adenosyltransferase